MASSLNLPYLPYLYESMNKIGKLEMASDLSFTSIFTRKTSSHDPQINWRLKFYND